MDKFCTAILEAEKMKQGSFGQTVSEKLKRTVFGEAASVSQSEFAAAGQNGLAPSLKFIMWDFEYSEERAAEIDGIAYTIYRTYRRDDGKIELYMERRMGDV